jgi:hypothetical protein
MSAIYATDSSTRHFENAGKESSFKDQKQATTRIRAPFDCGLGICSDDYVVKPAAMLKVQTDIVRGSECGDILKLTVIKCPNNSDMNFGAKVGQNQYPIKGSPDWIELPVEVDVGGSNYKISFSGPVSIRVADALGDIEEEVYWTYRADRSKPSCEGIISKGNTVECHLIIHYQRSDGK